MNVSGRAIKPCPFCGAAEIAVGMTRTFDEMVYTSPKKRERVVGYSFDVSCRGCGITTMKRITETKPLAEFSEVDVYDRAVEVWNTRSAESAESEN